MDTNTKQETPWVGYIILCVIILTLVGMCGQCGDDADKPAAVETAKIEDYKPTTNMSYRFLDKNQSVGDRQNPDSKTLRRSYAYQITGFDKTNPQCWSDLYDLAESVAERKDHEMITMVYFFAPSDSLVLWHDSDMKWNISWSDSQDSLWIGNYIRYGNGNTQMVKNWK